MTHDKSLNTVRRLRWMMRQKSRIAKLLHVPVAASIDCPYCEAKVHAGDFFCCSELEQMWARTEKRPAGEPVLAGNHS